MDFLFPEYRLDWFGAGPSSPNKTGALLAILFVMSWWPTLRFRWCFWLSLPLAFVSAALLLQTESRGAMAASVIGGILLIGTFGFNRLRALNRPLNSSVSFWVRAASTVVLLVVLSVYSHKLGVNNRIATMTTGDDESANVRVKLYSAGLQMIAAAPQGWGTGKAGDVYGQWYQDVGDNRSYLSLVNSHLTWMAEGGMLFQFLYITGWCFALMFCWPVPWTPLRAITFAVWVTLGLCGFFSSVLTLVWLWVVPVLLLALCVIQRLRSKQWPTKRQRLTVSYSVLAAFVGLHTTAHALSDGSRIEATPDYVEVGLTPQAIVLVQPDRQILGDKYGHTIRDYLNAISGLTVLYNESNKTDLSEFDTIAVSGSVDLSALSNSSGKVVWMNPPSEVDEVVFEALKSKSLTILVGSLGDWRRQRVWESLADENPNWNVLVLRGVADFIPNWPKYLITEEIE